MGQGSGWLTRSRWAAIGAAVAVSIGAASVLTISAAPSDAPSSFTPLTPCRLLDTRAGSDNVGPRSTPIGAAETYVSAVRGSNGNCVVPSTATSVSMNVTVVNPTDASFLTLFPSDVTRPTASNLNWVPQQAPTPNAVTSPLSGDGRLGIYNHAGTVDVIIDIVGFYQPLVEDPIRFDGAGVLSSSSRFFGLGNFGDGVAPASFRNVGWVATRDCTMGGTVKVLGGAAAGSFVLRLQAFNDADTLVRTSSNLTYDTSTPSGQERTIAGFTVLKGERIFVAELAIAGLTIATNSMAYYTFSCA